MTDSTATTPDERIARALAEAGWAVYENFLPAMQIRALADEARGRFAHGEFHAAGVGRGVRRQYQPEIRSDHVLWLDDTAPTAAQEPYFDALENLRVAINRKLFLGLFRFEGHLAIYPPGSFYRRHLDQFAGDARRTLSAILYLNDDWRAEDGGHLRIYLDDADDGAHVDVAPQGGTLACFLSERFYHEVLPARRERLSVTGWFRLRD